MLSQREGVDHEREILNSFPPQAPREKIHGIEETDKIERAVCAGASGGILKLSGSPQIGEAIRQEVDYLDRIRRGAIVGCR